MVRVRLSSYSYRREIAKYESHEAIAECHSSFLIGTARTNVIILVLAN